MAEEEPTNNNKETQEASSSEDASNVVQGQSMDIEVDTSNNQLLFENFPKIDDMGTSFIFDSCFTDDTPSLDFLGESMTDFSRVEELPSLFSPLELDGMSFEDFFKGL